MNDGLITYFLDTNALHHIYVYSSMAKTLHVDPCKDDSLAQVQSQFEPDGVQSWLKRAHSLLNRFSSSASDGVTAQVYYSHLGFIETISGLMKGHALVSVATKPGMPYRRWQSLNAEFVNGLMTSTDPQNIRNHVTEVFNWINDNLPFSLLSYESECEHVSVHQIAALILDRVYLEPIDSIIYASAAHALASFLVTSDKHLLNVANYIYNPGGAPDKWRAAYQAIQEHVKSKLGSGDATLPQGLDLRGG